MDTKCPICEHAREPIRPLGPTPCGHCAALAERWDDYIHIRKVFTVRGVRNQLKGVCEMLRAAGRNALGRTRLSAEKGRVHGVRAVLRLWTTHWWVLERRGWAKTRPLYHYPVGTEQTETVEPQTPQAGTRCRRQPRAVRLRATGQDHRDPRRSDPRQSEGPCAVRPLPPDVPRRR